MVGDEPFEDGAAVPIRLERTRDVALGLPYVADLHAANREVARAYGIAHICRHQLFGDSYGGFVTRQSSLQVSLQQLDTSDPPM